MLLKMINCNKIIIDGEEMTFFDGNSRIVGKKSECFRTGVEPTTFRLLVRMLLPPSYKRLIFRSEDEDDFEYEFLVLSMRITFRG